MKHKDKRRPVIRLNNIDPEVRNRVLSWLAGKPAPSDKEVYTGDVISLLHSQPELLHYFPGLQDEVTEG